MELRKNPEHDVYRRTRFHFQIGLVLALTIVVTSFEWKSETNDDIIVPDFEKGFDLVDYIPPTTIEKKQPPKPKITVPPKKRLIFEPTSDDLTEIARELVPENPIEADPEPYIPPIKEETPETVIYPEVWPEPEQGMDAFYAFLGKNIRYPARARQVALEGKVYVQFLVNEVGDITDIKVIKGIGMGCDEEVLRVMQLENLPKWLPGRSGGRKVRVRMVIPVYFSLQ